MKKSSLRWVLAAVCSSLSLLADHNHLKFQDVTKSFLLVDEDQNAPVTLKVQWSTMKPPGVSPGGPFAPNKYKVTVTATSGDLMNKIYSLWTLGIQSHDRVNTLSYAVSGTEILDGRYAKQTTLSVPATGKDAGTPRDTPKSLGIWFVKFTGSAKSYTFEVTEGDRAKGKVGISGWVGGNYGDGHDNTPPESDPS